MKIVKIVVLLAGLCMYGAADAHYRDYDRGGAGYRDRPVGLRVNAEQRRQRARIVRGIDRGQLTPNEYEQLARQQEHIAQAKRYFKRDGRLDRLERRILQDKMARASNDIRYYKHNQRYARDSYGYR